jgi:signal transduction histidine kinase
MKFKSIQRKTFLITLVTIFIFVGIFLVVEYTKDKNNLYARQVLHMKETSLAIRNTIESVRIPLMVQSILDGYVKDILQHEHTQYMNMDVQDNIPLHEIHVVNTEGVVMASTKPEFIGFPLEDAIQHKEEGLKNVLEGGVSYSIEQMEHLGVKVLDMSVPIRDNDQIIGALHYVEPYIKLETLVKESFVHHLVFALVLIISLTIFINLLLSKMVARPIMDLSRAMDRIRVRGTSDEITAAADDEIGLLAKSFNEMSDSLKQREQEVKHYTARLEEMVDERTKELQESQDQLIQTEKLASMGKLAGYIAHEINNPVGIIFSRAECILLDSKEKGYPEFLMKDIEVIKKHSNRIATIMKGMLTFSRKAPVEFSNVDINKIIEETVLLFEKQFSTQNIKVQKQIECDLPNIQGNGTQLQQVFFNIINNALDVMPNGGEISIQSVCDSGEMVHIIISDTGPGIPKEHLEKMFEPFFTTKEEGKGTGLGLSVTYGIIKEHKGDIKVSNRAGSGAVFEILLPLKHDHARKA